MAELIDGNEIPLPDLTYLRMMTDGDEESLKEVIAIFIEEGPKMLCRMKESAQTENHDQLKFVTHKLITQLTYVGILSVIVDVKIINSESRKMKDLTERVDKIIKVVNYSIENLKTMI